ncbi:MAG TPA: molybdenum cofactor guanylyltransferase MobA [Gammaproteobacteria bacterium]|nr:molybdenum cofactor guanylyltransferase MobA [Gammaproteobacteria bacterium]
MASRETVTAVVLAGGRGRRMGGREKGLLPLAGRPLIAHTVAALAPQVDRVVINANRELDAYGRLGLPVVPDAVPDQPGPLAGVLTALQEAGDGLVLTAPCDVPRLPGDLLTRMRAALDAAGTEVCTVHDGARLHQVILLLRPGAAEGLQAFLAEGGHRVEAWLRSQPFAEADFSDCPEAFANINTPEELERMEAEIERA